MDADVHHGRPLLDVLRPNHLPATRGDYEDIRPPGDLRQVARARVADGYGGVLAQEQLREGLAYQVRAPDDDGLLARELYCVALEQPDYAVRGAGQETRQAEGEPSGALGAQAVHVFCGVYARDQGHGVEAIWQR